jgi:transcriptional regulator with XRE-family HTH domain
MKGFTRVLQEALVAHGATISAIAEATKLPQSGLSRFLSGKRGLSMEGIETLVDFLNLQLVEEVEWEAYSVEERDRIEAYSWVR